MDVQFYRQRPIGDYIVDFYAPKAKLVIEVDGSQHREKNMYQRDRLRDDYMKSLGLRVLRFNSNEVLERTDSVVEAIYQTMVRLLNL